MSWYLIGIIALIVVIGSILNLISVIVVPLIIAIILGIILEPLDVFLEKRRVPPALASVLTLLVAIVVITGTATIVVVGFLQQMPEISKQLSQGWASTVQWARTLDIDPTLLERARSSLQDFAPKLGQNVLGAVSSTFSGALTFALGTFLAVFFLFFVLRDGRKFPFWFARVTSLESTLVHEVDRITRASLRGYFKGTAITALLTAPIFVIPLIIMKVPLVVPLTMMYLFLSFVPYVGAWITGLFAILIAFGSGGPIVALVVAVSLLVSNGAIQSAISSWALGASLRMHPVLVLISTIAGGTAAGILGMVLAPPLLAATIKSSSAIQKHRSKASKTES
ncbi:MAG TPA: AI-2E family transporter [Microbacteriaceae bacterium]|nr:AI-2E family transporter [Microbacteriaceae bacterium]